MRQVTPLLLALVITSLWGCPAKTKPPDKPTEACATDNDCVLTARRLNHCCVGCAIPYAVARSVGCAIPYAVARSRAAAIERWHRRHCKPGTFTCPKVDCSQPKAKQTAKCKQRRCVTEVTLGQPRIKPMR